MAEKSYYQYETSPRKLEPIKKPQKKSNNQNRTKKEKNKQEEKKILGLSETKKKIKMVWYLIIGFSVLFAIGYRNSQINEAFTKKQSLESEISQIKKENEQLEVNIQNNMNLSQIEALAKEKLGMQKLTSRQTIYIDLPKKDYVEPGTEEVIIEDKSTILDSIIAFFKNIIK